MLFPFLIHVAFAIIVFTLFLVFTNRENKIYHMVSNALITSIIISIGYAYLSFKVLPINKEIKFYKHIPNNKDELIKVESYEISEDIINKYQKSFIIFKCDDMEYLLESEKTDILPNNIKSIAVNGRFITKVEGNNDESKN